MLESQNIQLSPDDVFGALSNSRRRQVIVLTSRSREPLSAGALARKIAAVENQIDPDQVTGKQRSRVYIALIQSHLGRLDELGIIAFNDRAKVVARTDATQPVADYIGVLNRSCDAARGDA